MAQLELESVPVEVVGGLRPAASIDLRWHVLEHRPVGDAFLDTVSGLLGEAYERAAAPVDRVWVAMLAVVDGLAVPVGRCLGPLGAVCHRVRMAWRDLKGNEGGTSRRHQPPLSLGLGAAVLVAAGLLDGLGQTSLVPTGAAHDTSDGGVRRAARLRIPWARAVPVWVAVVPASAADCRVEIAQRGRARLRCPLRYNAACHTAALALRSRVRP